MKLTHSHILAVYFMASPADIAAGRHWYATAANIAADIATLHKVSAATAAGVIAALSPSNPWRRNIADAHALTAAYTLGGANDAARCKVGTYSANKTKSLAILKGADPLDVLGGLKVRAFYECIMGADSVCVDGHAYSIWRGERIATTATPKISPKLYSAIAADYRAAADIISTLGDPITAAQLQAVTWLTWRQLFRGDL